MQLLMARTRHDDISQKYVFGVSPKSSSFCRVLYDTKHELLKVALSLNLPLHAYCANSPIQALLAGLIGAVLTLDLSIIVAVAAVTVVAQVFLRELSKLYKVPL